GGFKLEDRFDRRRACTRDVTWRGTVGTESEPSRAASTRSEPADDRVRAFDGPDVPGERQHITPIAVRMKQGLEETLARPSQGQLELHEPVLGKSREVFRSIQHREAVRRVPEGTPIDLAT